MLHCVTADTQGNDMHANDYIEKIAPPQDEALPEDYQKAMDEDSDYQLFLDEIEEVAF